MVVFVVPVGPWAKTAVWRSVGVLEKMNRKRARTDTPHGSDLTSVASVYKIAPLAIAHNNDWLWILHLTCFRSRTGYPAPNMDHLGQYFPHTARLWSTWTTCAFAGPLSGPPGPISNLLDHFLIHLDQFRIWWTTFVRKMSCTLQLRTTMLGICR